MTLDHIFAAVLDDDHPQSAAMRAARDAGQALRDIAWRCGVEPDDSAAAHPGIRDAADRLANIFNEQAFVPSAAYADWQDDRRERLVATLAADHRVSDGHRGSLYLSSLDHHLQEPDQL